MLSRALFSLRREHRPRRREHLPLRSPHRDFRREAVPRTLDDLPRESQAIPREPQSIPPASRARRSAGSSLPPPPSSRRGSGAARSSRREDRRAPRAPLPRARPSRRPLPASRLDERAARPRVPLTPIWLLVAIVALHGGLHAPAAASLQRLDAAFHALISRVGQESARWPILCSGRWQIQQSALRGRRPVTPLSCPPGQCPDPRDEPMLVSSCLSPTSWWRPSTPRSRARPKRPTSTPARGSSRRHGPPSRTGCEDG